MWFAIGFGVRKRRLQNGCICCSINNNFIDSIFRILARDREVDYLEHFPSALNRRDSQPLSPRRIWGN